MKKLLALFLAVVAVPLMAQNTKGYKKTKDGLYYRLYNESKGTRPKEGDIVKLSLSYKNSKDSVIFDSKINSQDGTPFIEFMLTAPSFKGSFEDALTLMTEGDSASFLINADSVFLKSFLLPELPSYIAKGSMLTFNTRLVKVTSAEAYELQRVAMEEKAAAEAEANRVMESQVLEKYVKDHNIQVKPTPSGLYYVERVKGSGAAPGKGSKVKVNYTGRFLDGTIFDTSDEATAKAEGVYDARRPYKPIEFNLGEGMVIPGWEEGITLMSAGTKAQFILPSSIAYGAAGAGPIAPYSTLLFDVELVSFSPAE